MNPTITSLLAHCKSKIIPDWFSKHSSLLATFKKSKTTLYQTKHVVLLFNCYLAITFDRKQTMKQTVLHYICNSIIIPMIHKFMTIIKNIIDLILETAKIKFSERILATAIYKKRVQITIYHSMIFRDNQQLFVNKLPY